MQEYFGTKRLNAKRMTRGEYNTLRGWTLPADENGEDEGYLVEYLDNVEANVEGYDGYVSWSPKSVFEATYQPLDALSFGHALVALKGGKKVARAGWFVAGMWVVLVRRTEGIAFSPPHPYSLQVSEVKTINPHIDMMTATGEMQPGWTASQTDMLSNDWYIVE